MKITWVPPFQLNPTTTADGPILRGFYKNCRIECDRMGKWLHIIAEKTGAVDHFERDPETKIWETESLAGVTDDWSSHDYDVITLELDRASTAERKIWEAQ